MQIEIPNDLVERLKERFDDPIDAIRQALDSQDLRDREVAAIRAGLASADASNVRPLGDFDRNFRERNGIQ